MEFFRNKDHRILPSDSLIPHGDPTLLLTVAGMVPFKKYFLGLEKPVYPRVATSQRCIRTGDIENVGKTDRHGTFFEMLGNFSFGDYFKKEIIPWSWEFVRDYLKLPPEKLWVTIYLDDDEAEEIWRKSVGIPPERIVRLGKEDNFWETGSGPCGPCSEIHIDRGVEFGCGKADCKPGCDCDRFFEFWNLVFIQYEQKGDQYIPLAKKSVDTGMGLERVAALLQGKPSIFEIDNVKPIVDGIARLAGIKYGEDEENDVSLRVIADHLRAVTFLVFDGVLPTNEGRGYVLRRLLRRAIRHARLLNLNEPFLNTGVDLVAGEMAQPYPELAGRLDYIHKVVGLEEERFNQTLDQGIRLLDDLIAAAKKAKATIIDGKDAFQLYDTFGFPLELTTEILAEHGLEVDQAAFQAAMAAQRERARKARTATGYLDEGLAAYQNLANTVEVEFLGYGQPTAAAKLLGIIAAGREVDSASAGEEVALVLDRTPFYAESGGQTADTGLITTETGRVRIKDVQRPIEGLISHLGVVEDGFVTVGSDVQAAIDTKLRQETARHHSATHLLHSVLKKTLGEHVNQAGSYVGPDRLRFDFTHFQALTPAELLNIEERVNAIILQNEPVSAQVTDLETAKKKGALALFGEKYDERVRMVQIGAESLELCGGTHVRATGELGLFKIISEGSVAAGVRRIEAVVGFEALEYVREREAILQQAQERLPGQVAELPQLIDGLLARNRELEREITSLQEKRVLASLDDLLSGAETIDGVSLLAAEVEAQDAETLRKIGDRLRDRLEPGAVLLGARSEGRVLFLSMISKPLTKKGFHAGEVVKAAAKVCGGGGGGRPDMAQAGGRNAEKLPEALQAGLKILRQQLEGINS